jgi:phage/plasmid-associated DNA primase
MGINEFEKQLKEKGLSDGDVRIIINRLKGDMSDGVELYNAIVKRHTADGIWPDTKRFVKEVLKVGLPIEFDDLPPEIFKMDDEGQPVKINIPAFSNFILSREKIIFVDDEVYNYNENKHVWIKDGENIIYRYLHRDEIEPFYNDYLRREVLSFIKSKNFIKSEELNKGFNDGFINFQNGEVKIETMEVLPHDPSRYFTWVLDYDFIPELKIPEEMFKAMITWTYPDYTKFITLLESIAFPFISEYPIKRAFLLIGERDRGKSKLLQLFNLILNQDNVSQVDLKTLLHDSWSRIQLVGKLANVWSDLSESAITREEMGIFKMLTGEDYMDLRLMHTQKFVRLSNSAKLYFSANSPPDFSQGANDMAFMGRWQFILFENDIKNKDPDIVKKLKQDIPILYPWLLLIAKKLKNRNALTFQQDLDEIQEIYLSASAKAIDKFIAKYLKYDPQAQTKISDVHNALQKFCQENGYPAVNQTEMGRKIKTQFLVDIKHNKDNEKLYIGLKLLENPRNEIEKFKFEKDEFIEQICNYLYQLYEFFQSISVLGQINNNLIDKDFLKTGLTGIVNDAIDNIISENDKNEENEKESLSEIDKNPADSDPLDDLSFKNSEELIIKDAMDRVVESEEPNDIHKS